MRRVCWIGKVNTAEDLEYKPMPQNRVKLERSTKGIWLAIAILMGFCLGILFLKRKLAGNFKLGIFSKIAAVVISIGALFFHEYLHTIPYDKNYDSYIGIDNNCKMLFSFCADPISKKKYIISSLLPALIGIIPLIGFIICPISFTQLNSFLWIFGTINLLTPIVDYIDVLEVLRKVPKYGFVQSGKDGFYYFTKKSV